MNDIIYAVREDKVAEEDWSTGTVMYSIDGETGPWRDMVSGPVDYCWEVLDALVFWQEGQARMREEQAARLRMELAQDMVENARYD